MSGYASYRAATAEAEELRAKADAKVQATCHRREGLRVNL